MRAVHTAPSPLAPSPLAPSPTADAIGVSARGANGSSQSFPTGIGLVGALPAVNVQMPPSLVHCRSRSAAVWCQRYFISPVERPG